jgi:hypothetical protein
MKTETFTCDIKDCKRKAIEKDVRMQIIFTTEQTEGYPTKHHFSMEKIDLCEECYAHALKGNYIFGSGAQGYNKYWFKNTEQQ